MKMSLLHITPLKSNQQQGTGIKNWSKKVKWNGQFRSDRSNRVYKVVHLERWTRFFEFFCIWTELIHSVLDRNFRKFWLNGSRPLIMEQLQEMKPGH